MYHFLHDDVDWNLRKWIKISLHGFVNTEIRFHVHHDDVLLTLGGGSEIDAFFRVISDPVVFSRSDVCTGPIFTIMWSICENFG